MLYNISPNTQDLSIFKYQLDTLDIAKYSVRKNNSNRPDNYRLSTIYNYVTSKELENSHSADADVGATVDILRHDQFWKDRKTMLKIINTTAIRQQSHNIGTNDSNDSDTDNEDDLEDSDNENDDEATDSSQNLTQWSLNTSFEGVNSREKFEHEFARPDTRSIQGGSRIGLQASVNSVNSPIKSWRYIFTDGILNKIVRYSNDYGAEHCPKWREITRQDLTDFIAVLFIVSVQKRKDTSSNWFSNDPLLENIPVKKVMTGNKFHRIL